MTTPVSNDQLASLYQKSTPIDISFIEGDESLQSFPSRLRDLLQTQINNQNSNAPSVLLRHVGDSTLYVPNGRDPHYKVALTYERLLTARYCFETVFEVVVVQENAGSTLDNGTAVLVVHGGQSKIGITHKGEGNTSRQDCFIWKPEYGRPIDDYKPQIYFDTEIINSARKTRPSVLEESQSDSDSRGPPAQSTKFKSPLGFKKSQGELSELFPNYLAADIKYFVSKYNERPACARAKKAGCDLFLYQGKETEYRLQFTHEVLLASRYLAGKYFYDVVRADSGSNVFGGQSVLIGAKAKGDQRQESEGGRKVVKTSYYAWRRDGTLAGPKIEKWIYQDKKVASQANHSTLPHRARSESEALRATPMEKRSTMDELDSGRSTASQHQAANTTNSGSRVAEPLPGYRIVSNDTPLYDQETTDDEDESEIEPREDSAIESLATMQQGPKIIRRLSDAGMGSFAKRRKTDDFRPQSQPPTIVQRPAERDGETLTLARDSVDDSSISTRQCNTIQQIDDSNPPRRRTLDVVPARLDDHSSSGNHFFVFRDHILDAGHYPAKSIGNVDEVSLLFAHAREAGIADRATSVLLLSSRMRTWKIVRKDADKFDEVVEFLRGVQVAQSIVVTPDTDG